jgi:hypothetical protein
MSGMKKAAWDHAALYKKKEASGQASVPARLFDR